MNIDLISLVPSINFIGLDYYPKKAQFQKTNKVELLVRWGARPKSLSPNKNYKWSLMICIFLFSLVACNFSYTKQSYFEDFQLFVLQAEQNHINYSTQDWVNSDIEYDLFTSDLYQKVYSELTQVDQLEIGRLKARYQKIKVKTEINSTIQSIRDGMEQTVGALEELIDSIN